jgi:hypothetical protein
MTKRLCGSVARLANISIYLVGKAKHKVYLNTMSRIILYKLLNSSGINQQSVLGMVHDTVAVSDTVCRVLHPSPSLKLSPRSSDRLFRRG